MLLISPLLISPSRPAHDHGKILRFCGEISISMLDPHSPLRHFPLSHLARLSLLRELILLALTGFNPPLLEMLSKTPYEVRTPVSL
eukprot:g79462.t1